METIAHITMADAARRCPGRPSANAVWRWCRKGVRSRNGETIRLEHIRVGGRIFTTADALTRFFSEVALADTTHFERSDQSAHTPTICQTSENIEKRVERANKLLTQTGF